jgi:hypothetical protein
MSTGTDNQPNGQPQGLARPLASGLAVLAGILRLVPHWPNFTPVGALGIFAGARLRSWHAFALPLVVMAATDVALFVLNGFPPLDASLYGILLVEVSVYCAFLGNVLLGRFLARTESPWCIAGISLLASVQFFVVTNFAMWLACSQLPGPVTFAPTLEGLLLCYVAGLPFFGYTLLGDLGYCGLLFGAHALLTRGFFRAERVAAPALPNP